MKTGCGATYGYFRLGVLDAVAPNTHRVSSLYRISTALQEQKGSGTEVVKTICDFVCAFRHAFASTRKRFHTTFVLPPGIFLANLAHHRNPDGDGQGTSLDLVICQMFK